MVTEGDGRVHVETSKGHCIFTIEGAERQDEGIYSVVVRNPAGEDTADINVKVVGTLVRYYDTYKAAITVLYSIIYFVKPI